MSSPSPPKLSSRKKPQQSRSSDLVDAILQAAVKVLAEHGVQRFTTARVADRAGVSVGSVYQYFPNKVAILFQLQSDEWARTTATMVEILGDATRLPQSRIRALAHAFIQSECDEAMVRAALGNEAPRYRETKESREATLSIDRAMHRFMAHALPDASLEIRATAGSLIRTTLNAVGKRYSMQARDPSEVHAYAEAMADMFCAYLSDLAQRGASSHHSR